jgi:hypothetical protein
MKIDKKVWNTPKVNSILQSITETTQGAPGTSPSAEGGFDTYAS